MKKIFNLIVLITISALLTSACACAKKPDYSAYISDLRKDIFVGENDDFGVTVWSGARETPYASDGVKNETLLNLTVKVVAKQEKGDKIAATVCYDENEYAVDLKFHPVKSAMSASVNVNVLPEKQVIIKLSYGSEECTITLNSALNSNTVSYFDAVNKAVDYCADYIKNHTEKGKFNAEISVRLLAENGNNYYYVGFFATDGEKKAVLVDGETCTILAEKNN